ncbi:MAG: HDIG domain-containing metalloprotein [candidate division WOR-3 bacterium]
MKNLRKTEIQKIKKKASENLPITFTFFILLLLTLLALNRLHFKSDYKRLPPRSYIVKEIKVTQTPFFVKATPQELRAIDRDSLSPVELGVLEYIEHQYSKPVIDNLYTFTEKGILLKDESKFLTIPPESTLRISEIKRGIFNLLSEFGLSESEKDRILLRFLPLLKPNLVLAGIKYDTVVSTRSLVTEEKSINPEYKRLLLNLYWVLIFTISFIMILRELKRRKDSRKASVLILSYLILLFYPSLLTEVVSSTSIFLLPLPLILGAFFTGFNLTFLLSLAFVSILLPVVEGNLLVVLLLNIPIALVSILYGERIKKPWNYLEAFFITTATALMLNAIFNQSGLQRIYQNSIIITLICGTSILGFILVHPILEKIFKFPSVFTLVELTNMNHPLLLQLQNQAPGTFEHSIRVAELGARVAGSIGVNPLLARACGLYHDIGKMLHPIFFIENQVSGENPHNRISPEMSVQILRSHVIDGVNLAKKYKLPEEIIRVIATHHGTSIMLSIYKKASSINLDVDKDKFRYSGPKPRTKLEGVFMIVDGVEAASRALDERTEDKFKQLVNEIIKEKIEDGQFSECELTYAEIEQIKNELIKALLSHYHLRIKYHEDKGY